MLIAHVSDLHVGRDADTDRAVERLALALEDADVSAAVVTGDVTHRGREDELARFQAAFRRIHGRGKLVVVPGNHDRLGEGAGRRFMPCARVDVVGRPGLHLVRLDSTGPHNRRPLAAHGLLSQADLGAVDSALDAAAEGSLTVLALHHHLLPLPPDALCERISGLLGWPFAAELPLGAELLRRILGRCDLVLHGHRHAPSELVLGADTERPLRVLNAGSTPELGRFRVVSSRAGRPGAAGWVEVEGDGSLPLAGAPVWVAA